MGCQSSTSTSTLEQRRLSASSNASRSLIDSQKFQNCKSGSKHRLFASSRRLSTKTCSNTIARAYYLNHARTYIRESVPSRHTVALAPPRRRRNSIFSHGHTRVGACRPFPTSNFDPTHISFATIRPTSHLSYRPHSFDLIPNFE
jgi:hypothetical protein